jgi:hypothetical protein
MKSERTMSRTLTSALALTSLLGISLLSACPAPSAPEGAILRIQFLDIRATAVDEVRLSMTPQMGQRFMMQPASTVDGVTVAVDSTGILTLTIPGDVFRRDAVQSGASDLSPSFDLEVWSDDTTMNTAPQLRATVTQGMEVIGNGAVFVREWPLVLGSTTSVSVMCNATTTTQCGRM